MRLLGILITVTLAAHYTYIYFRLRNAVGPGWKWTALYLGLTLFLVFGSRALWQVDLGDYPELYHIRRGRMMLGGHRNPPPSGMVSDRVLRKTSQTEILTSLRSSG